MRLVRYTYYICSFRQQLRIFRKFMYRCQKHASTCATLQMLSQFCSTLHRHNTIISYKCFCFTKLFRQLHIKVRTVCNQHYCRTRKLSTAHQHPCQKQHRITLTTSCCSKIRSALTISICVQLAMLAYICKKFVRSKELRVTTHYFHLIFRRIWQKHKVFHHAQQSLFSKQTLHHCHQSIYTINRHIIRLHFSPCIKEIVWRKQRPIFTIHSITYHHKSVILKQIRNISPVSHSQLRICIMYCGLLFHRTLKFQHHHRQTIHIHYSVWYSLFRSFYFQLIHYTENIILHAVKINWFYK